MVSFSHVAIFGRASNSQSFANDSLDRDQKDSPNVLATCRNRYVDDSLSLFNKVLIVFVVLTALFVLLGGTEYPGLIGG